ncbi:hypothetical protein M422DRAFT_40487 [Sphaerobolus stellatus SS14]|nr:hypothetical protein M422DRAFT_40487 [Sphaerobolus stellatus SS14]
MGCEVPALGHPDTGSIQAPTVEHATHDRDALYVLQDARNNLGDSYTPSTLADSVPLPEMLNLDHRHPNDKNSNGNLLRSDWHKPHGLSLDSADPSVLNVDPSHNPYPQTDLSRSSLPIDPVTPADAVDPNPAPANPSPETPGDLLSQPNDNESTSSLTPPPPLDNARSMATNEHRVEGNDASVGDSHTRPSPSAGALAAGSRQSTPLTELSNPNTPSKGKDEDGTNADANAEDKGDMSAGASGSALRDGGDENKGEESAKGNDSGHAQGRPSGSGASSMPTATQHSNGTTSGGSSLPDGSAQQPRHASQKTSADAADDKVATLLELNSEILKVLFEFQSRQQLQVPEFAEYTNRMNSNLTYLASCAERKPSPPLPIMSPPPPVSFVSTQHINELYQKLPNLFAKDIAKRQKEASLASMGGVKRVAESSSDDNVMRKRVDTGERRMSNPPMSAGSPPMARSSSVMSNGPGGSSMNPAAVGMNALNPEPMAQGGMGMGMGMVLPQSASQQQSYMRVSPESMSMGNPQGLPAGMEMAQMHRARQQPPHLRQIQANVPQKDPQRMPPPPLPNGMQNMGGRPEGNPPAQAPQLQQAVLQTFGQSGLQNFNALQQGPNHPFVLYMVNHVPGFMQMPLQDKLRKMQGVQQQIQQTRAERALVAGGMNGMNAQGMDPALQFSRQGSPPNINPLQPQHSGGGMPHVSPPPQVPGLAGGGGGGYGGSNGILPMQAGMQGRPNPMAGQNMGGGGGMGGMPSGLPPGLNINNMTPQQRQLLLMQQQMHQRGNDGVVNPQQQAYAAAAQEKLRMEQQSRMSNHQQSPTHAGSPPHSSHGGMGTPSVSGMSGMQSPSEMTPGTPGMAQKRSQGQMDTYQMALYNQAQAQQRANMNMMRPGTSMGMSPQQQQQQQQQRHHQSHQQAVQFSGNGTINPGMMYGGGNGMNVQGTPQQNWQQSPGAQQQQFHSISPAALQHHPDAGTPRPGSSASNNAMMPGDGMGDGSFDSLFNWSGT